MAKSVSLIHARSLEIVVVMMNAVMAMVAIIIAQSFGLEDRSVLRFRLSSRY